MCSRFMARVHFRILKMMKLRWDSGVVGQEVGGQAAKMCEASKMKNNKGCQVRLKALAKDSDKS